MKPRKATVGSTACLMRFVLFLSIDIPRVAVCARSLHSSRQTGANEPAQLHSAHMPAHVIQISDVDAKASGVLRRMRLDGLDTATVPFHERCVRAWRRGAPKPGMDVETLIQILWVSFCLTYLVTVCTPDVRLASIPVVLRQCSPPCSKVQGNRQSPN